MKHITIILLAVLVSSAVRAQDGRNLPQDREYKKHSDSTAYYFKLWEQSGHKNDQYFQKMSHYRAKAMDRAWVIYDSTSRAKKP